MLVAATGVAFDSCSIWREQVGFIVLERIAVHTTTTGLFVFNYFQFGEVALGFEVAFVANYLFLRTDLVAEDEWVTFVVFLFGHWLQIPLQSHLSHGCLLDDA